eukprot:12482520-Prorocentrum_lima.AAC.1
MLPSGTTNGAGVHPLEHDPFRVTQMVGWGWQGVAAAHLSCFPLSLVPEWAASRQWTLPP